MQNLPAEMKVAEQQIERLEDEMQERGIKPVSNDARPIKGRKAAYADKQRRHYATQVKKAREQNPRFKGFRTTQSSRGAAPQVGPSEKALARAERKP